MRLEIDAGLEAPALATRILLGIAVGTAATSDRSQNGNHAGHQRPADSPWCGNRPLLLITQGFADMHCALANKTGQTLFALSITKSPPLTDSVIEVSERLDAKSVIRSNPLIWTNLRDDLKSIKTVRDRIAGDLFFALTRQ